MCYMRNCQCLLNFVPKHLLNPYNMKKSFLIAILTFLMAFSAQAQNITVLLLLATKDHSCT